MSRFGLPFALLLVLLGLAVVPVSAVGGAPGVVIGSVTAPPSMHDDLDNRPGLSTPSVHAVATAWHETWWAVCAGATGGDAPRGRWGLGEVAGAGAAAGLATSRCSRAPPA